MKKITRLTTAQKAAIPAYIEKWKKISLSTDPINFELAKESVIKLYELSGLQPPKQIIKILSPLKMKNVKFIGEDSDLSGLSAWHEIHHTIDSKLEDYINCRVSSTERLAINIEIHNVIGKLINIGVIESDEIDHNNAISGSIWSYYYAYCSFVREILNIKLPEIYNNDEQLALNSIFSIFGKNIAYICDRPKSIKTQTINNTYRLHNTSGPAVLWRDNSKYWSIEGIEVDEQIVMKPETQTIKQIYGEGNEERRRIRIEQYGWIKYLKESGAKLINSRINERDNQQEQLYAHEESNRFVCVDPSTGRKYAIAVPRRIRTCITAQKYLSHGLDEFAIHRS